MSTQPQGDLTTRTLAMPADANPSGDIFGGWVLSQMDIAGGIHAGQHAQGRVATVAIEAMASPTKPMLSTNTVRTTPVTVIPLSVAR